MAPVTRSRDVGPALTVACIGGLANRLRILFSGIALSELTGHEFTLLWPRSRACGATFPELFANDWNVVEVTEAEAIALPALGGFAAGKLPNLATGAAPAPFRTGVWLMPKDTCWRSHRQWNGESAMPADIVASAWLRVVELDRELMPVAAVQERADAFRASSFRPTMIGVHLRRGDFARFRPEVTGNFAAVARRVDDYLEEAPDAGILLCTDDGAPDAYRGHEIPTEGVKEAFEERFPGRVVATDPRSLVRGEREAVEDALVDLLLLRQVSMFVGTKGSSFSELATLGRDVPTAVLGRGRPRDRVMRYSGVEAGVIGLGVLTLGRVMPASTVLRQWRRRARRGLSRGGAK